MFLTIILTLFGSGSRGGFVSNRRIHRLNTKKRPSNNKKQTDQIDAVVDILGLNKKQRRELHRKYKGEKNDQTRYKLHKKQTLYTNRPTSTKL